MKRKRLMVKIDEDKCDGCGLCIPACPLGAIQIVDGKARVIDERLCDGFGACIGECPKGAITVEEVEAEDFDPEVARKHLEAMGKSPEEIEEIIRHAEEELAMAQKGIHHQDHHSHAHGHHGVSCPSAAAQEWKTKEISSADIPSALTHWPVKLALVNPKASFLQGKELLVTADCVPVAYGSFHKDFLEGKAVVIGCPKLDDVNFYLDRLTQIFKESDIRGIHVVHMEVPCCRGLYYLVQEALKRAGTNIPVKCTIVGIKGNVLKSE